MRSIKAITLLAIITLVTYSVHASDTGQGAVPTSRVRFAVQGLDNPQLTPTLQLGGCGINSRECQPAIDFTRGFNIISEKLAKELQLAIVTPTDSDGTTDMPDLRLAMVDSLTIGNTSLRNVVFVVASESDSNPTGDVVLGVQALNGLGVITIDFHNRELIAHDSDPFNSDNASDLTYNSKGTYDVRAGMCKLNTDHGTIDLYSLLPHDVVRIDTDNMLISAVSMRGMLADNRQGSKFRMGHYEPLDQSEISDDEINRRRQHRAQSELDKTISGATEVIISTMRAIDDVRDTFGRKPLFFKH